MQKGTMSATPCILIEWRVKEGDERRAKIVKFVLENKVFPIGAIGYGSPTMSVGCYRIADGKKLARFLKSLGLKTLDGD